MKITRLVLAAMAMTAACSSGPPSSPVSQPAASLTPSTLSLASKSTNAFLRAPPVSTMPSGWTGPTWFQVHGPLALGALNADTDAVPGSPYLGSGFDTSGNATAVFVPVNPTGVDPATALLGMAGALDRFGIVTQHAYVPVMIPKLEPNASPGPGGHTVAADVVCISTDSTNGSPRMACIGRSDVINVAETAERLATDRSNLVPRR